MDNEPSSAAHVNDVGTPHERDAAETKYLFASTPNPVSLSIPSATRTNPSLESSSYRVAVTPPLCHDVAAVTVTAADLHGAPRLTGESNQNV